MGNPAETEIEINMRLPIGYWLISTRAISSTLDAAVSISLAKSNLINAEATSFKIAVMVALALFNSRINRNLRKLPQKEAISLKH